MSKKQCLWCGGNTYDGYECKLCAEEHSEPMVLSASASLKPAKKDIVVKPSHYTRWKIEPVTYVMRNGMEFWRGNIVKYASRAGFKKYDHLDETDSEIADLKKVIRYAEMRINQLEGETEL